MSPERIGLAMVVVPALLLWAALIVLSARQGDRERAVITLAVPILFAYIATAMYLVGGGTS